MELEEIKERILAEIKQTEIQIGVYEEATKPISPDDAIGRVSRMDAINNKSVAEASLRQTKQKLQGLQRVMSQIGSKEFGTCLKCKNKIPLGRILIRPQSLLCVHCAQ